MAPCSACCNTLVGLFDRMQGIRQARVCRVMSKSRLLAGRLVARGVGGHRLVAQTTNTAAFIMPAA